MTEASTDVELRQAIASARARSRPRDVTGRFTAAEAVARVSDTETDETEAEDQAAFEAELRDHAQRPTRVSGRRPASDLLI
jgi:hypothetical protein